MLVSLSNQMGYSAEICFKNSRICNSTDYTPLSHLLTPSDIQSDMRNDINSALYFKLGNHKLLIWSSHLQQRVKRVFQRGRLKIKLQTEAKVPAKSLTRKPKVEEPKKSKKAKKPKS